MIFGISGFANFILNRMEMFDIVTAIQVNHYFRKAERIAIIKNCYDALAENGIYISSENAHVR